MGVGFVGHFKWSMVASVNEEKMGRSRIGSAGMRLVYS